MNLRLTIAEADLSTLNVSAFCRDHGLSRDRFYAIRRRYDSEGAAGLESRSRAPHRVSNRTPASIEDLVVSKRKELDDLTGEQDVLAGLGHDAVGGGDHEDRAVHLRGTGDHVLHIVSVAWAVNVEGGTVDARHVGCNLRGVIGSGGAVGGQKDVLEHGGVTFFFRVGKTGADSS